MGSLWDNLVDAFMMARGKYKYSPLPSRDRIAEAQETLTFWARNHQKVLKYTMAVLAAMVFWYLAASTA